MRIAAKQGFEFVNIQHIGRDHGAALLRTLAVWRRRRTERRQLARELPSMPDEALRDLGLTRKTAHVASRKPFWRA